MEQGTYTAKPEPVDALAVARQICRADGEGRARRFSGNCVDPRGRHRPHRRIPSWSAPRSRCSIRCWRTWCGMPWRLHLRMVWSLFRFPGEKPPAIAIHNSGVIPASIRERFFQKFVTSGKQSGTGLGAYSAQLIARTLGGGITFQTSVEEGTTLTVSLPLPPRRSRRCSDDRLRPGRRSLRRLSFPGRLHSRTAADTARRPYRPGAREAIFSNCEKSFHETSGVKVVHAQLELLFRGPFQFPQFRIVGIEHLVHGDRLLLAPEFSPCREIEN